MPKNAFRYTNPPNNFFVSGPEALRAYFFPRQVLQIQETARILGIRREALYKRLWRGDESLKIRKFPSGRQYILLEDLISYLFDSETSKNKELESLSSANCTHSVLEERKKPGRPRGSKNKVR